MKEKILVLVRATPEKSRKHGYTSCVAGINERDEFRRLYSFKFSEIKFRKKQWIEAELVKNDNDRRNESRKVASYKPVQSIIGDAKLARKLSTLATSVAALKKSKASLGVVKPEILDVKIDVRDTNIVDEQTFFSQLESGQLGLREKVKIPVRVRYFYKCKSPGCACSVKPHFQVFIDWEVNELARNLLRRYQNKLIVTAKMKEKLLYWMKKRDVFFILGTHFKFKTWMIIGIFYFRKNLASQKSLEEF